MRAGLINCRAAIDMAIQATTEAQLERAEGRGCAWAMGDIKSAFNYTRKSTVLARLQQKDPNHAHLEGLTRYIQWCYQSREADITWDGEIRTKTSIKSGVPQGSPLSPVLFLIGVAKVFEDADLRIQKEISSHQIKTFSYVDDFNCTARQSPTAPARRGRKTEAITAARKA